MKTFFFKGISSLIFKKKKGKKYLDLNETYLEMLRKRIVIIYWNDWEDCSKKYLGNMRRNNKIDKTPFYRL